MTSELDVPEELAWDVPVSGPTGTMANELEENESKREPSKSISGTAEVLGALWAAA